MLQNHPLSLRRTCETLLEDTLALRLREHERKARCREEEQRRQKLRTCQIPPFRESGFCFQSRSVKYIRFDAFSEKWLMILLKLFLFYCVLCFSFSATCICCTSTSYMECFHLLCVYIYITLMFSSTRFHWVLLIPILIQWDMWWQRRKQLRSPASLKDLTFAQQQELGSMARGARFLREKTHAGSRLKMATARFVEGDVWRSPVGSTPFWLLVWNMNVVFFHILDLVGWLVGWEFHHPFQTCFFHSVGNFILPADLNSMIFQRGRSTWSTRSIIMTIYGKFQ